jgi:predicted transposase YdaD
MPILDDIMDHDLLGPLIRRGQQEGRQEGRHEGELTVILRLLRKRFGVLQIGTEERLAARSVRYPPAR